MKRLGIQPGGIGRVIVSHLHGDHFGGLPFLILDGQFSGRANALEIVGPPGTAKRLVAAMDVLFPGSSTATRRFGFTVHELHERAPTNFGDVEVTGYTVAHASGAPSLALRIRHENGVIAYSGDTEWTETLVEVARDADLFVCEVYFYDKKVKHHLDYATLRANRQRLSCRRIVLTHMSSNLLDRLHEVDLETPRMG